MKKIFIHIIGIFLVINLAFYNISTYKTYASELDPSSYKPGSVSDIDEDFVHKYGGDISSMLFGIAIIIAVIAVMFVGIKYITVGSLAQKAEYKKDLIPMAVGMVLVACLSAILGLIARFAAMI